MDTKFWSIKNHIQHWVDINKLKNLSVVGADPGSRMVSIWLLNGSMTSSQFMKKYPIIETKYFKGYLTKDTHPNLIHVSFQRKKL